jgi:hypothetical protein
MRWAAGILAIALLGLGACGDEHECTVPEGVDPDWIRTLGCDLDYDLLATERDDSVFARTKTINWLIDREDGYRTYFIDSVEWELHYFFANAYLNKEGLTPVGTHPEFNILNYRRENRRFVLGKLIRYVDQDLMTIEFSAGDTADADMIVDAYERVSGALYDGDRLLYRPVSSFHESILDDIASRIPVISTEDVFRGQTYQPLNDGVGYGTLQFRRVAELAGQALLPTDLVVLDRVPNDISMVAGIITSEFQTPLAHINILSKNRGTPNMGLRDAFDDAELRSFEGELVRVEVGPQAWSIEAASPAEAQAYWDSLRPSQPLVPDYDLTATAFQNIAAIGTSDSIRVGAKAANMGEMTNIDGIPLPDAPFAIPFARFDAHITDHGLWEDIDAVIADAPSLDPQQLAERLFDIRWQIYTAPMEPVFRDELIAEATARWGADRRLRFRSSTNVEDLEEFSGAGLYTSAGAQVDEGAQAIENAVKVVWASAWNYQAFVERDWYRVDHRRVRMGVLVHPSFVDEEANGVALTINEFTQSRPAYYINSQVGEVSVTNPTGAATPEQILYYTWYEEPEYEVITRSSLLDGEAVFTDSELDELASYLEAIHQHFRIVFGGGNDFAMDVEFKLDEGRQLFIKQARPFKAR